MNKAKLLIVGFMIVGVFEYALLAQPNQGGNQGNQGANQGNQKQEILREVPLNDFESAEDWRAFATSPLGDTKIRKTLQQGPFVLDQNKLNDEEKNQFKSGQNHVLGVKTWFNDRGYDRVEVKPPHEYVIKGIGRQLSVWVLGRKYRHTLYAKFRDYKGNIHKLRMGRMDFLGWRKMIITIPGWLPQSTRYALFDKNLHFVSMFVESDKHEVGGDFYFYIDDLRIKIDESEMTYPGSQIKDTW